MAPKTTPLIRRVTFALLVLASGATEVAAVDTRNVLTSLGLAAIWVGLAGAFSLFAKAPAEGRRVPPLHVFLILLLLGALPFVVEQFRRRWTRDGYPLELQMVFAFRNVGLGLAAFSIWPLCQRLACIVSLFLILFAVTLTSHPAVHWLLGLYTVTGSVWLLLVYWAGLQAAGLADAPVVEVHSISRRVPWLAGAVFLCVSAGAVAIAVVGPRRAAITLGEWLPTSGGTGANDPYASGGVNDGDDVIKGDDPRTTGMVMTDVFLESTLPGLYDIGKDTYGEPLIVKEHERNIALDSQTTALKENDKPPANSERPNGEFSTARKGPSRPRDAADRAARALFEVEGRTPLHVRTTPFDRFDGVSWHEAPVNLTTCRLEKEKGSCWMKMLNSGPAAIYSDGERHRFKICAPIGALVPAPPYPTRFRIGRVDQADFFAWGRERILRMSQRKTPSGIIVETDSCTLDPRRLAATVFPDLGPASTVLPAGSRPEIAALARRWIEGQAPGWPQVAAVVGHLRSDYIHDRAAHTPEGCTDPLGNFLFEARRGPDYQFASAAAVLLRTLGFTTRLVGGFYVSPDHYDAETRHTPVVNEDLHFWAEVALPAGVWMVIEPTPGYEILGPAPSLWDRSLAACAAAGLWLWQHLVLIGISSACLIAAWRSRAEIIDAMAVWFLRGFPGRTWADCVRRLVWLLEWRGRRVGRPRPLSQTPSAWLRATLAAKTNRSDDLTQLTKMADWSAYASALDPPWSTAEMRGVCRRVLDDWTLRRWRTVAAANVVRGE